MIALHLTDYEVMSSCSSLKDNQTKVTTASPSGVISLHEPLHRSSSDCWPRSSLKSRCRITEPVRFACDECVVYNVERWGEFDDDVDQEKKRINPIWYTRDEYDIIKARNSLIVKMMKTGNFDESRDHSFRGLEHKLRAGFKQRRSNKFAALNAVLEEQDRQVSHGINDQGIIAEAYRLSTLGAKETAFLVACRDVKESLNYAGITIASDNGDLSNVTIEVKFLTDDDVSDMGSVISRDSTRQEEKLRRIFDKVNGRREQRMSTARRRASA
jgi:hypothetical protein